MVEWLAQFDACEVCSSFAGELFTVEESFGLIPEHPNCFTSPEIPIYTSKGWKPIGDVEVDDLVLTHKGRFRKVTQLHRAEKQLPDVVTIKAGSETCYTTLSGITSNHPVLVNGKWAEAGKAEVGQKICMMNDFPKCKFYDFPVKEVTVKKQEKPITTYNLSVDEDESYVAKGFVVHNCLCSWAPIVGPDLL